MLTSMISNAAGLSGFIESRLVLLCAAQSIDNFVCDITGRVAITNAKICQRSCPIFDNGQTTRKFWVNKDVLNLLK